MAHDAAVAAGIEAGRRACNFIMPEGPARAMFAAWCLAKAQENWPGSLQDWLRQQAKELTDE